MAVDLMGCYAPRRANDQLASCRPRSCPPGGRQRGAAAAEPDAGLHEAEPGRVGRHVRHLHVLLLVGHGRRGQRLQGPEPHVLREAAAVRPQAEALRRRPLRGHHQRQPLPLLQEKV
uniref:Uncharacterized protein n=1 Tax=Zea mays TaxID=4577 RepID=B8A251_MAIZE|nr:unknown [Zea mays]